MAQQHPTPVSSSACLEYKVLRELVNFSNKTKLQALLIFIETRINYGLLH